MKSTQIKTISTLVSVAALLIGFQNCSKAKISSDDITVANESLNTDQLPDGSSTDVNQPNSPPPVGDNSGSGMGSPAPAPTPDSGGVPPATDDPRALCNLSAASSSSIEEIFNSMKNDLGQIKELSGLNGKIVVIGASTLGTHQLDLITHSGGKIILCGLEVEEISHTNGRLILVDTKVQRCYKHSGRMEIVGTSVCNEITSSRVNIKVQRKE